MTIGQVEGPKSIASLTGLRHAVPLANSKSCPLGEYRNVNMTLVIRLYSDGVACVPCQPMALFRIGGTGVKAAAYLAGVLGGTADLLAGVGLRSVHRLSASSANRPAPAQSAANGGSLLVRLRGLIKPILPGKLARILAALLFCMLAASGYGIVAVAGQQLLRSEAQTIARGWAKYLTANAVDLSQIVAGQEPSTATRDLLGRVFGNGDVFKLEIVNRAGEARFSSQIQGPNVPRWVDTADERNAEITHAHSDQVDLKDELVDNFGDGHYFIEASVPIKDGPAVIGVMSFYLDMTERYQVLLRIVTRATISFGLVLAIAFGLPGIGFWLRTRQKEKAESQLSFLSQHDALTELANRSTAMRRLEALLTANAESGTGIAVLSMDLDHFKEVNDALGHENGDQLLKDVANRLRLTLHSGEHVSRAGGDEFLIIQDNVEGRNCAENLAQRLLTSFSRPFMLGEQVLHISPSIGVSLSPVDGSEAELLVKKADLALYAVKTGERGTFKFFDATMDRQLQRRRAIAEHVRAACEESGFKLNYQPVYSLATGLLAGFEALVRLPRTDGTMVSPAEFIPIAEELGLITRIGAFVLETACEQAAQWADDLTVAVNVSPAEFREGKVVERVAAALVKSGLKPERLEIEVTEGVLLADTETTRKTMDGLKELGVAIVLDDFGTGYSSLSYLWQFRFDKIKIDQSFVKAIGTNDNVNDIIRTIIALGRALDLRVTAEGVETEAQASVLRAMRCDLVQGYLYGVPVAQPDVPAFVSRPLPRSLAASAERAGLAIRQAAG